MRLIKLLTKAAAALLMAVFAILIAYICWVLYSFPDIPVEQLEQKYGGDGLKVAAVDGVNIRYKDEGLRQGPVLLLLHSHYYSMRQWQGWVDELAQDFRIIRYDLTSHGLTGPDPSGDYGYDRGVVLADGLMQQLEIERFSIAGSSTGGAIAFHYAARHPQKVQALVLINTPAMPKISNPYVDRTLPSWGWVMFYLLPESLFTSFLSFPVVDKSLIDDSAVKEFHEMYRRSGNRRAEYQRMSQWRFHDVTDVLKTIAAPTLLLWGAENPQLPASSVALFAKKLSASTRVESIIYPAIGHVIPIENPRQSAADARRFIRESL